jgi:hypothetical protein
MSDHIRGRLFLVAASLAVLGLPGCASMRPISSTPPLPKIVLKSSHDERAFQGVLPPTPFHVILPPGEYRPLYEDDSAYYYQAPTKVVVNDLTSSLYDGGIYVSRGSNAPTGWYYIGQYENGSSINSGVFKTPLPLK